MRILLIGAVEDYTLQSFCPVLFSPTTNTVYSIKRDLGEFTILAVRELHCVRLKMCCVHRKSESNVIIPNYTDLLEDVTQHVQIHKNKRAEISAIKGILWLPKWGASCLPLGRSLRQIKLVTGISALGSAYTQITGSQEN